MRTLFTPISDRPSPEAQSRAQSLFQSAAKASGRSLAMAAPMVREARRLVGEMELRDARPWRAGRGPARFEPGGGTEGTETEARYGLPERFGVEERRRYAWAPGVLKGTEPAAPSDLSAAAETASGLYVQLGDRLFLLSEERARVLPEERFSVPRTKEFRLVSTGDGPQLRPALPARAETAGASVENLRVQFYGAGRFRATTRATLSRKVTEGPLDLPGWSGDKKDLGHLYDPEGRRRQYSAVGGRLTIGQVIPGEGPPSSGFLLHYEASEEIASESSAGAAELQEHDLIGGVLGGGTASEPALENAERLWGYSFALLTQERSWRVDGRGHAGNVSTGHRVRSGIGGRYQLILCGDRRLSVVDPVAEKLRYSQDLLSVTGGDRILAPTWTREGCPGVAIAFEGEVRVFALRPAGPTQSEEATFHYD